MIRKIALPAIAAAALSLAAVTGATAAQQVQPGWNLLGVAEDYTIGEYVDTLDTANCDRVTVHRWDTWGWDVWYSDNAAASDLTHVYEGDGVWVGCW